MGAPDFVGHMGDGEGWFRYPAGRSAEHVNAGTFTLAIDDTSSTQNFRLRDLTWRERTSIGRRAAPARARSAGR